MSCLFALISCRASFQTSKSAEMSMAKDAPFSVKAWSIAKQDLDDSTLQNEIDRVSETHRHKSSLNRGEFMLQELSAHASLNPGKISVSCEMDEDEVNRSLSTLGHEIWKSAPRKGFAKRREAECAE